MSPGTLVRLLTSTKAAWGRVERTGCRVNSMRQEEVPPSIEAHHMQIQLAQEFITQPPRR